MGVSGIQIFTHIKVKLMIRAASIFSKRGLPLKDKIRSILERTLSLKNSSLWDGKPITPIRRYSLNVYNFHYAPAYLRNGRYA